MDETATRRAWRATCRRQQLSENRTKFGVSYVINLTLQVEKKIFTACVFNVENPVWRQLGRSVVVVKYERVN